MMAGCKKAYTAGNVYVDKTKNFAVMAKEDEPKGYEDNVCISCMNGDVA